MNRIRKYIEAWLAWLKHVITEPRHELDRWQTTVRYTYDLGIHGWKALQRDNAPQMASALSYRSLFALLPVIVVSTVVVRAVRGDEGFQSLVSGVLNALGWYGIPFGEQTLGKWVEGLVKSATTLNYAALGWIGLAVVAYSAISLLVTIENSFNSIYGAPEGRSWMRRVPTYWLLLTMSPVIVGTMLYLNNRFEQAISEVHTLAWMLTAVKIIWGFVVAWLFMFAVYRLVPNTKVATKAALVGSFVSAALLTLGKTSLNAYFGKGEALQSLYGALGAIPLFMFWVYLMWLAVLFGLEVSATIQTVQGRPLQELEEKRPQNGLVDPASVLNVMEIITERFAQSKSATPREIADETHMVEAIVCQIIERLIHARLLHRVDGGDGAIALACPPEQVSADRLIEIGFAMVDEGSTGRRSALVEALRAAQTTLAQNATLASLLLPSGQNTAANQVPAR